ncbi:ceramide synthase component, putative [Candida dubliniensis CD36]|uniref:Ceramide synthase component, putative n=1 Tax=Candida dubliniensis (strain CD36 / ATCC MYA-646 / CBS 7987 / NCPF 3949 / NRRL Y-17841) TaxID=573826 RepID=B9WKU1_CANDC|nr:ceramide synthase component, putative [Candida dubliniensis CD36]CAX39641.1 ceramide synthase component, putative [Candida dubliniensis CD36]
MSSSSSSLGVPHESSIRRRSSSVGRIDVGDTSASLSTMPTTRSSRRRSIARLRELQDNSTTDSAIVHKLYIGFRELTYRHTWIIPLMVLIMAFGTFYLSSPSGKVHQILEDMIIPSYHIPGTDQYGKGGNDFKFVGFYALFFTFLREFMMCCVLRPIAVWFGIKKEAKQKRFLEQTYAMFYYGITGPFGLWIMRRLPLWYFNTTQFYVDYPHKTHDIFFKIYYLGQAAFWVQQSVVLILQLEKPRKDFKELVLHHIITIALIWCSYRFHFTWMGLAVYITMDISDFFLALSKTLNYLESPITGPFFVIFIGVWIYLRHYINLQILWSVLTEFKTVGDYELNWITQQYKCWISQPITFSLIFALQLVNFYWLVLIFRILYRYIFTGVSKDERSDDEEEEDEYSEDSADEKKKEQ